MDLAISLAEELYAADTARGGRSLGSGSAGSAVVFAVLGATLDDERYARAAQRSLAAALDEAAGTPEGMGLGLYGGLAGVGFAGAVVAAASGGVPADAGDVDGVLLDAVAGGWRGPWGLSDGLVGIGTYALIPGAGRVALRRAVLDALADALADEARTRGGRASSLATPHLGAAARPSDLGMAQGLAGLVAFAAMAWRAGDRHAPLVAAGSLGALLAHLPPGASGAQQPGPGTPGAWVCGSAPCWCCGDLAVATALSAVGPLVVHPLVVPALRRALSAVPEGPDTASPAGLGLCHGVAGVAHVLSRLAAAGGDGRSRRAAYRWATALVDRLGAGERGDGPGVADGDGGIVLALLALATGVVPAWDRMLLLR